MESQCPEKISESDGEEVTVKQEPLSPDDSESDADLAVEIVKTTYPKEQQTGGYHANELSSVGPQSPSESGQAELRPKSLVGEGKMVLSAARNHEISIYRYEKTVLITVPEECNCRRVQRIDSTASIPYGETKFWEENGHHLDEMQELSILGGSLEYSLINDQGPGR